jgi:ParB-like chromosome segregation protein Spo0J
MEVKRVAISTLKASSYNPQSRLNSNRMTALTKSIERIGLIYPIAVTKKMQVIDGHRRLAACKALGIEHVPVLIVESDEIPETIYAEINASACNLSGSQNLQVWLDNPLAVTERARKIFEAAQERFGLRILQSLAAKNMSVTLLRAANEVSRFVGAEDDVQFVRRAARWIMAHRNVRLVRSYCDMQQSPKTLYNAINNNKEIKSSYATA